MFLLVRTKLLIILLVTYQALPNTVKDKLPVYPVIDKD